MMFNYGVHIMRNTPLDGNVKGLLNLSSRAYNCISRVDIRQAPQPIFSAR